VGSSCRRAATAHRRRIVPVVVRRSVLLPLGRDVWSQLGLKPHLVETFKISTDSRFEEKLVDVVGLYLNPPDKAVVFCFEERSQVQALDRTQPSLPLKPGQAAAMTHDYKRHGNGAAPPAGPRDPRQTTAPTPTPKCRHG
jgi:hypothetical protein